MQVKYQVNVIAAFVFIKIDLSEPIESDFSLVAKRSSFIDKSLLIKDLFKYEMVLLIAPPGYGKSTNLDMVKRFLEVEVDEHGKRSPVYITDNYELFKRKDLKICRYPYDLFFDEHFGKHPVLHIDYTELCGVNSFDDMLSTFREILYRTFLPHKQILNDDELQWFDSNAKSQFSKYSDAQEYKKLSKENITRGFFWLSRMMCEHYSKRVFILIDEYNTYLKCLPEKGIPEANKIIDFVQAINDDLIKFNAFIDHAMLVGEPLHNDTDVWPDNVQKFRFLEKHKFQNYFGVLENEVSKTLKKNYFKKNLREEVEKHLVEKHDGLIVGEKKIYSFLTYLSVFRNLTNEM